MKGLKYIIPALLVAVIPLTGFAQSAHNPEAERTVSAWADAQTIPVVAAWVDAQQRRMMARNLAPQSEESKDDPTAGLAKFAQFYRYLNNSYVDTVPNDTLIESAIIEILGQLDPHSTYLSAEEMVSVRESFNASFSGIGVEFNVLKDTIIVVNVIAGGPSEKVGILPNDRIIYVNDENVVGTNRADVPGILRGPKGTRVSMKIRRESEKELLEFVVIRDDIPLNTVDAAYKVDDKTGYIKVNRFAATTYKEVEEAFEKFGKINGLIVDVRGNGGGHLDQAILLSNMFLPKGALIVSTEGMRVPDDKISAEGNGIYMNGRLIVLTDEGSASASEIVAGVVQDWDRGLIIGRPTFGKGLVQRQYPLADGSAVRITVARYHTPSGRVIQRPYEPGDAEAYYEEFAHQATSGFKVDSTKIYKTLRTGRTVYGGGGITPDIVVSVDTTQYTDYWMNLVRKGVITDFVLNYMDKNRASLENAYADIDSYIAGFNLDEQILQELISMGTDKDIEFSESEYLKSEGGIKTQLKALIAQKLWGMNEYYMIMNSDNDPVFSKAVEVISNWNNYSSDIAK